MPSPPTGASKTIYVTPPQPKGSRLLPELKPKGQLRLPSPPPKETPAPRTPSPNARYVTAPQPKGSTLLPELKPKRGGGSSGMGGTSNGSAATPATSPPPPKSGGAPPPAAGAAAGFNFGPGAQLFWKGVGAGIGWEASRRFQGGASEIVSQQKEQEAIRRAERQRQQRYLSNPPATEVIEKEKFEFEGGQSPGVMYRITYFYKQVIYDAGDQTNLITGTTDIQGPIRGTYVQLGIPRNRGDLTYYDFSELGFLRGNNQKFAVFIGQGYGPKSEWKILSIARVDGLPDTGGNPPPTQQGSSSQYNGAAPGAIAGAASSAPPPAIPKPQPQPQPRPTGDGNSTKKPAPQPPPTLYAPGVRGNIGGSGAPSPDSLGGQQYNGGPQSRITYETGSGPGSEMPQGTPSGLPEGVGSSSGLGGQSGTGGQTGTGTQTQTGTGTETTPETPTIPFPPPLLFAPAPGGGNVTDVEFPDGNPTVERQEEKKVTQTAPPTSCESSNACVLGPVKEIGNKQNTLLERLGNLADATDLTLLPIINNKLGDQLPGGISGYFKKAWQATRMDKVINLMNLLLNVHNAAMLSRNLAETLGDAASAVLQFLGIKDHEQQAIDVNEVLGKSITELIKSVLGEEVYTGVSKQWNLYNRIITAGMGVVAAIQNMVNAAIDGINTIASWLAKMGNRAQEQGLVDDNSWPWMDENPNFRNPTARFLEKIDDLEEAADSVYMLVSSGIEIQEGYTEAVQATTALATVLNEANETKNATELTEKGANTSPIPTKLDVIKHESEEQ